MTTEPVPPHVPADRVFDIDIYALPGQREDYHQAWRTLQESAPELVWTPRNEGHWIALRGQVLAEVQSDPARFSSRNILIPKSIGELHGLIPTTIDPPAHRPYRLLLNGTLAPNAIRRMHASIRAVAIELIDNFRSAGHCNFTADYARIFPIRIFMALVDLPIEHAPMIRRWAESMTRPAPEMPFEVAKQAFFDYLDPVIHARRAAPGDDFISRMVNEAVDGRVVDHAEALSLATQVLIAGVDTVVNILGFIMLFMARSPSHRRQLIDDPSLLPHAAHELFRRFGLVTIARTVVDDMEYRGVLLKQGEMVAIPTVVHGIDAQANSDPMEVYFHRARARHSAFGSGPHMCPGQELARAEVTITLEEWLKRIPDFHVADDSDTRASGGIVGSIDRLCLAWKPNA